MTQDNQPGPDQVVKALTIYFQVCNLEAGLAKVKDIDQPIRPSSIDLYNRILETAKKTLAVDINIATCVDYLARFDYQTRQQVYEAGEVEWRAVTVSEILAQLAAVKGALEAFISLYMCAEEKEKVGFKVYSEREKEKEQEEKKEH